jgi:hypothetical protein
MEYFNNALKENKYPFIPRKTPITIEEIKHLWMPSTIRNIDIVAEAEGKVIGSGTILMGNDNQYSLDSKRESGEYSITIHQDFINKGIETAITKEMINEAKKRKIHFHLHVSIDDKLMINIMEKLGYKPKEKITYYERYAKEGLNPAVYFYELP